MSPMTAEFKFLTVAWLRIHFCQDVALSLNTGLPTFRKGVTSSSSGIKRSTIF